MDQHIVLGGPGCGKTRTLMDILDHELAAGVRPDEIGFFAFTRKAASEARDRAAERFKLTEDDLPYFRTLHSFAFRQLGLTTSEVMGDTDFKTLGAALNLQFGRVDEETGAIQSYDNKGDQIAYVEQMSRLTGETLEQACSRLQMQRYWDVKLYSDTLRDYKRSRGVFDFTDMLELFILQGSCPPLKVVFVDEAQDLSPLQWRMVTLIKQNAERVYLAGDDDQAIYEWSGADIRTFLRLEGNVRVLPLSHRLPSTVFDRACILQGRIQSRYSKVWGPARQGGSIQRYGNTSLVDFVPGSWMLLARNRYMLADFVEVLRKRGLPYVLYGKSSVDNDSIRAILTWERLRKGEQEPASAIKLLAARLRPGHGFDKKIFQQFDDKYPFKFEDLKMSIPKDEDWMTAVRLTDKEREYYRAALRRKESLIKWPRITVATMHGVKGGESDHVLVGTDMSHACYRSLQRNPDSEHRVFYVGITRAKESLHIIHPRTSMSYHV